jgi:hypothetical protein
MSDSSEDRELLARLQAADPAQRTPVPPKHWISELTEATMNDTNTDETRSGQGRRTWVLVAAAAVVIGTLGVGAVAALNGGDDKGPSTAGQTTAKTASVTKLEAPAESTAMCATPHAKMLADYADMAVDAVVLSTAGDQVTLDVGHWYTGDATDRVEVTAPSVELMPLLGSVDLQKGERYLLAGQDGQLIVCGFSGAYDSKLAAMYEKAFTK